MVMLLRSVKKNLIKSEGSQVFFLFDAAKIQLFFDISKFFYMLYNIKIDCTAKKNAFFVIFLPKNLHFKQKKRIFAPLIRKKMHRLIEKDSKDCVFLRG